MGKNYFIVHYKEIFAISKAKNVDIGVAAEMFRADNREALRKTMTDAEINSAFGEYNDFVLANYVELCEAVK